MRMVTPPKVSSAVLITADPSVTEELFTTALPTPPTLFLGCQNVGVVRSTSRKGQSTRTCVDLIDNLLRRLFVEIVYYDIRAAGTVEQRVPRCETTFGQRKAVRMERKRTLFQDRRQRL